MKYLSVFVIALLGVPIIVSQILMIYAYSFILNRNRKRVKIDYTKGFIFQNQVRLSFNQIAFYIDTNTSEDADSYSLIVKFEANEICLKDFDDYQEAEEFFNRINNFMKSETLA